MKGLNFFAYRSIPACAGEPISAQSRSCQSEVYPRMRGGTIAHPCLSASIEGLSPRARGNRPSRRASFAPRGSIPACAGEPRHRCRNRQEAKVYPRVRGGTQSKRLKHPFPQGLSPRARGNHGITSAHILTPRSIPACAGEPTTQPTLSIWQQVYPRVRGGTWITSGCTRDDPGLSPRARGNLACPIPISRNQRSIPACAGEPPRRPARRRSRRVYPRVRGGTFKSEASSTTTSGLSPRARGNPNR